jgi:hypothetical protein
MNNENLDLSAILAVIEPGYVVVMHGDGHQQILLTQLMDVAPGVQGSVGFELDGADGVIGRPVFLHRRMTIRHLGSLEDYLEEPFVQSVFGEITRLIDRRLGVLPVIAVIEALRVDPDACIADVAAAVLERRRALWASASAS